MLFSSIFLWLPQYMQMYRKCLLCTFRMFSEIIRYLFDIYIYEVLNLFMVSSGEVFHLYVSSR